MLLNAYTELRKAMDLELPNEWMVLIMLISCFSIIIFTGYRLEPAPQKRSDLNPTRLPIPPTCNLSHFKKFLNLS